jgi:hypothetical protein
MIYKLESLGVAHLTHLEAAELVARLLSDFASQPQGGPRTDNAVVQNFIAELGGKLTQFQKALLKVQANSATQTIAQLDEVRDLAPQVFRKAVNLACLSDVPAEAEAAQKLAILMKMYRNVESLNYEAETQALDKLTAELEGTYAPQIALLGFGRYVARLKKSNDAFKALFGGRSTQTALQEVFDTRALRTDLLDKYREFALYLQVMANLPQGDYYIQLLAFVNTARKYYADMLARRRGRSQSKDSEPSAD